MRVAVVCVLMLVAGGCSGSDAPEEIERIDGPAVVDEDGDGELDG